MPNFLHATIAALVLPLFFTGGLAAATPKISSQGLPYDFQELFTVKLNVGKIQAPLNIPGGVLINEPITGGTVTGSAINGTILSGFAHPLVYGTGATQVQYPVIDVYGTTDDGQSFYIHEEGIGIGAAQVTRIPKFQIRGTNFEWVINIGGAKYKILRDSFILASVNPNADKTAVNVRGYSVTNNLP